jgi:hypothetical protein
MARGNGERDHGGVSLSEGGVGGGKEVVTVGEKTRGDVGWVPGWCALVWY